MEIRAERRRHATHGQRSRRIAPQQVGGRDHDLLAAEARRTAAADRGGDGAGASCIM